MADMNSTIDSMDFEAMAPGEGLPAEKTPEEMAEIAKTLDSLDPADILKYMIDSGKLPEETKLVEPEAEEGAADMAEDMMEAPPADMAGLEGLSFEGI